MKIIAIIAGALLIVAHFSYAADVYTWTDKNGVTHISDQPPQHSVKLKSIDKFKREQRERGNISPDMPHHVRPNRAATRQDVDRVIMEDAARSRRTPSSSYSDGESPAEKEARKQRIKDEIEDLEAESLRLQHYKSTTWSNDSKRSWHDQQRQVDRQIERKKKELFNVH